MKVVLTDRAIEALKDAPTTVQRAFDKQLRFLGTNLLHPSLRTKKFSESENLWQARVNQARVNKDWRFYFKIENDTYIIVRIIPHPK